MQAAKDLNAKASTPEKKKSMKADVSKELAKLKAADSAKNNDTDLDAEDYDSESSGGSEFDREISKQYSAINEAAKAAGWDESEEGKA